MKHRYILIPIFTILAIGSTKGQIVIGTDKEPEKFCIVEVESKKGGIRLPRIPDTNKNNMITTHSLTSNPESAGLVIYNSTNNIIEFWDGNRWVALSNKISGANGLTDTNGKELWLGGKLDDNTTVQMNNNELKIQHNPAAKFIINDTMVVVNNKIVDIRVAWEFMVNDTVISIKGKYVDMRPAILSINNNTFSMNESGRTRMTGTFQYTDGTQDQGHLLTANNKGDAYWGALRPLGTVKSTSINNNKGFASSTVQVSDGMLELPAGQWLIFAKFNSNMNASLTGMYHWILLSSKTPSQSSYTTISRAGANPEKKTAGTGIKSYATPFILHYVNIKEKTQYIIQAGTSNAGNSATVSETWIGNSYFYALRIDIPTD